MRFKWFATSVMLVVSGLAFFVAGSAAADDASGNYPDRPIRMIVTVPPGGAADLVARTVAAGLTKQLRQTVIVENRPGANGAIGAAYVAKSAPDGYTLLNATISTHGIGPYFSKNLSYDPYKDFAPVGEIVEFPLILAVNSKLPVKSVKDLIAFAHKTGRKLTFASAGVGSAPHLAGELFAVETGLSMLHVPYKGSAPGAADVAAGRVDMMFDGIPSLRPFIDSGKLRPIAAVGAKRNPVLPKLPTFTELGYPAIVASLWYGLMAPAGTPAPIITRLNVALNKCLSMPDVRKALEAVGAQVKSGSPADFAAFIEKDHARWGDVIRKAGISTEN